LSTTVTKLAIDQLWIQKLHSKCELSILTHAAETTLHNDFTTLNMAESRTRWYFWQEV